MKAREASIDSWWAAVDRLAAHGNRYLPVQTCIEADHLVAELGVPAPSLAFGRPCLAGTAHLLREGAAFPFNYEADGEAAAPRLLVQLAREAATRGS